MSVALQRTPGWRARFEREIDAIKHLPFAWGEHDCGPDLVGRLVEATTGADIFAPWRGRYQSYRGAVRVMRNDGFGNLADLIGSVLPEIHPSEATLGDVAAFAEKSELGFTLGIVNGERVFVLKEEGLGTLDLLQADKAYRVG